MRLIVGLCLVFAPSARAQSIVAPVEGLGRTVVAAPIPWLAAPSMIVPSALLSPSLSAPSAALFQVPAPVKLEAVDAAVVRFSAIDLKSAPAADVRGGGDALMLRALGAVVPEAPVGVLASPSAGDAPLSPSEPGTAKAPAPDPHVHLLSNPLHATVELGLLARVLHYAVEIGLQLAKAALAWHATGSPAAALGVLAFEAIKVPPMITAQSLADLGLRWWWKRLAAVRRLADTPGVTRVRVLTTGEVEFAGILARRKENVGLVFVDAKDSLPADIPGFGAPLGVRNLDERRVRLTLIHEGDADSNEWTPTLNELLSGAPIPPGIAEAWRARLDADKKDKTPLRRLFDFKKEKELRIEARLGAADEAPRTVVFGRSVKRLIGLGRWDRLKALFGAAPARRAIPISDTIVERGGVKVVNGAVRRAWRRLTGRLLVRP